MSVNELKINRDRLLGNINSLATIGSLRLGGVCRLAYSPEDISARQLVQVWMENAGLTVRIDPAGNIIGRYEGKNAQKGALATGSHLDTVPTGGRYDGAYGVLAGIEVARVLQENNIRLERPFEVIVFTDEEGTMLGSKAMSGQLINDPAAYLQPNGTDIQTCLKRIGGDWSKIQKSCRTEDEIYAFIELHIEQGPVLESMRKNIGVVQGIVGQRRFKITVEGCANHAGTTPMEMRQDALVAASKAVLVVNQLAKNSVKTVATVGQLQVYPNAVNVVPGQVEMSLDIRDLSNEKLDFLLMQFKEQLTAIQQNTQTRICAESCLWADPVLADDFVQNAIASTCDTLGLTYTHLPSRAGHDAQFMAKITKMGMIFVPSVSGVSHSQTEYTSEEDCVNGANVLLHTLLAMLH